MSPDDVHNRQLLASVRPPSWVNPAPAGRYQLVVIGAGPAGLVSAVGAAGLGAKVAIVERHMLGGECLNVGCVPSKAILRAARAAREVRRAGEFGVVVPEGVRVDFGSVMERMRRVRAELSPHDSASRLQGLGIDVFFGQAEFVGPDRLRVEGAELRFGRAIVATGSRPAMPEIPGLAESRPLTNETVFSLTQLPRRLAVLGAGPVGCELAQAFGRFGAEVTLIGKQPRVLPRDDPDAAAIVANSLARDGVSLRLGSVAEAASFGENRAAAPATLHIRSSGADETLEIDAIMVAAGRTPNVEGLGLEAAGVRFGPEGIEVDDRLRTSNPRIYAAGDVASSFKFTHAADALARVAVQNALMPLGARASRLVIPWCTYTDPELAHVGLSAEDAATRGIPIDTFTHEFSRIDRAVLDGDAEGFVRIHVRRGSDRIVGATIVGPHAGEMISEVALAMTNGLGLKALVSTIHPYPTHSEAIRKAAEAWNRTRLTPFVRSLMGTWLRWMR